VDLQPLAWWDCGLKSYLWHGCLSFVNVVCCQVEVSVSCWSLIQRNPTKCGVSGCDHKASIMKRPWHTRGCCAIGVGGMLYFLFFGIYTLLYLNILLNFLCLFLNTLFYCVLTPYWSNYLFHKKWIHPFLFPDRYV
jgi:hypothetical protein